jgi:hypothetical protein
MLSPDRIKALKESNQFPDEEEEAIIRRTLADGPKALQELTSTIEQMRQDLSTLEANVAHTAAALEAGQVTLNPVRRLCDDILCEIFAHTASHDHVGTPLKKRNMWAFVKVCSRWRRAGISCASVWAHVAVDCTHDPAHYYGRTVGTPMLLSLQLYYARDLPLCVTLSNTSTLGARSDMPHPLYTVVVSMLLRCHSLILMPPVVLAGIEPVMPFLSGLRALEIKGKNVYHDNSLASFASAPCLASISVDYMPSTPPPQIQHRITRYELTYLRGFPYHPTTILDTIKQLTALEVCILACQSAVDERPQPVKLPHLRELHLFGVDGTGISSICSKLHAPRLTTLEIAGQFEHTAGLETCIKSSGCHIHTLLLSITISLDMCMRRLGSVTTRPNWDYIHSFISLLTHLNRLEISPFCSGFIKSDIFSLMKDNSVQMPQLRKMTFPCSVLDLIFDWSPIDVVEKQRGSGQLEEVVMYIDGGFSALPAETKGRIATLKKEGLRFYVVGN